MEIKPAPTSVAVWHEAFADLSPFDMACRIISTFAGYNFTSPQHGRDILHLQHAIEAIQGRRA